jgi:hypothetical protein
MLIQVMQRTQKSSGDIAFLTDKNVSDKVGTWSPDARFAQICESDTYDVWDFENNDRRAKIYDYAYHLVNVETEVYYTICTPWGWIFVTEVPGQHGLRKTVEYSKTQCSIILGEDYEEVRQSIVNIMCYERHVKTRQFPVWS